MIKCGLCKKEKEEIEFHKHTKRGFMKWCKSCRKEYDKLYHSKNAIKRREQAKCRKKKNQKLISELKEKLVCIRCGEDHPACIDFHHKDPAHKLFNIGMAIQQGFAAAKILEEIEKCDVLCSNCHRKLHWKEKYSGSSSVQ